MGRVEVIIAALEARPDAWQADAQALLGASREPHSAADYLAAVRAACLDLWDVDTGNDGADCILSTVSASHALADVAEHARETESGAHPEGRAAWARERGWTATRLDADPKGRWRVITDAGETADVTADSAADALDIVADRAGYPRRLAHEGGIPAVIGPDGEPAAEGTYRRPWTATRIGT